MEKGVKNVSKDIEIDLLTQISWLLFKTALNDAGKPVKFEEVWLQEDGEVAIVANFFEGDFTKFQLENEDWRYKPRPDLN
jgi:hypothetical protein